jgi:hypothetical protein
LNRAGNRIGGKGRREEENIPIGIIGTKKNGETMRITPIVVMIGRPHISKLYIAIGSEVSSESWSRENLFKILPKKRYEKKRYKNSFFSISFYLHLYTTMSVC